MAVAILLATYNGACFLPKQLESYLQQAYQDWVLLASDDASTDTTVDILKKFQKLRPGQVHLRQGPAAGAAKNYLSLLQQAPEAEYTAFSDQDDFWLPNKLKRAVEILRKIPRDVPAVYASRVTICDEQLHPLTLTSRPTRQLGFRNALVQNLLHGHSIVLNQAGVALLRQALLNNPPIVMHDWWVYQVISGASGEVVLDNESHVLYRQHSRNEVGANWGRRAWSGRLKRLRMRKQAQWMQANLISLASTEHCLTKGHYQLVMDLIRARQRNKLSFALACLRGGLYRQGWEGRIVPFVASLTGRL